jgi:hypothetical protein
MTASAVCLTSCEVLSVAISARTRFSITCHVQTDQVEHPSEIMRLPIDGQEMTFKKVPEFSQRSIAAFQPFPADDGQGNGLLLQLDAKGKNYLEAASRLQQGMIMLTMINAVPVDMVQLDQPITDGRFTIWRGVSARDHQGDLDKFYPHINRMKSQSKLRWTCCLPPTRMKLNARESMRRSRSRREKSANATWSAASCRRLRRPE